MSVQAYKYVIDKQKLSSLGKLQYLFCFSACADTLLAYARKMRYSFENGSKVRPDRKTNKTCKRSNAVRHFQIMIVYLQYNTYIHTNASNLVKSSDKVQQTHTIFKNRIVILFAAISLVHTII